MKNSLINFLDLHNGEESRQRVLENVTANISFRGSNLWILACAIVIASVGLNVNSTAVIIGAMLISPLMGPIVGAGFALGTYDFQLLKRSFKNLLIATFVSLLVSGAYFFVSPFKETQSELLARTYPTIYDVLIAFFGGLVGVIAITRVEKGNPIPGVAIATALMPPLCTAGYGLAVGNFHYFLGAFYLYSINCFFICIATFIIIKYLKYPPVNQLQSRHERLIRNGIIVLIFIMIVPSFYLAYDLLREKTFSQKAEQFIRQEFTQKGYPVIYKKITYNSNPRKVELAFLNRKFMKDEITGIEEKMRVSGITNTRLIIRQDERDIKSEIISELGIQSQVLSEKDLRITRLQRELSEYKFDDPGLLKEIEILFPGMHDITIGKHLTRASQDSVHIVTVVVYKARKKELRGEEEKLQAWLKSKLNTNNLQLIRQQE